MDKMNKQAHVNATVHISGYFCTRVTCWVFNQGKCVCASKWERSGPCGLLKAAQNSFSPLAFLPLYAGYILALVTTKDSTERKKKREKNGTRPDSSCPKPLVKKAYSWMFCGELGLFLLTGLATSEISDLPDLEIS